MKTYDELLIEEMERVHGNNFKFDTDEIPYRIHKTVAKTYAKQALDEAAKQAMFSYQHNYSPYQELERSLHTDNYNIYINEDSILDVKFQLK